MYCQTLHSLTIIPIVRASVPCIVTAAWNLNPLRQKGATPKRQKREYADHDRYRQASPG